MGFHGEDPLAKRASVSIGLTNLEFDGRAEAGLETGRGSYPAPSTRTHTTEQGFSPMHQIAFMLVLGSTSGLFSRAPQVQTTCPNGNCAQQYVAAPAPTYAPKYGQPVAPAYNSYYYAPQQRQAAPAAPAAPAYNSYYYAPQQQQAAPVAAQRPAYYYPAQPTAACPTGTCPYAR
jgi:hypothetical protein